MTLRALIEDAVAKYGSQSAAADAIGLSRTRINRILSDAGAPGESFEVGNCLRLARALGQSASEVLRAACKADDANLIEEMYGPDHDIVLTPDERRVVTAMRTGQLADVFTVVLKPRKQQKG
jgi:transcriptional regulator with XRE-family HTH domain